MNFWQSIRGTLRLEITSADIHRTLDGLNALGIALFHPEILDMLTARLTVIRSDYPLAAKFCEKQGDTIRICSKQGFYWLTEKAKKRPVLMAGTVLLLLLILFLPTRVFFFEVEGNTQIPEKRILEAAAESGIRFGASRRDIRSEKMKNALLGALPQLQWAGINTFGCRAVISVKEREQTAESAVCGDVTGIVAARDGVILSCTVTRGNPVCTVGQAVKKNQLLVSPYVDCGLSIKAVSAEGEVFAHTNRKIRAFLPSEYISLEGSGHTVRHYSLIFGKKRINLHNGSGISDATCGRMYAEYYITLPGGFRLPVCLAVDTLFSRSGTASEVSQTEAEQMLRSFSREYVSRQMIAGEILSEDHLMEEASHIRVLNSSYTCSEMIGRIKAERNGEWNE